MPALFIVACIALAGCGTNLSREEFVARADAVCAAAPLLSHQVLEDLKQLVPPRDLAGEYGKFLDEAKKKKWPEAAQAARESGLDECAALAEAATP